MTLWSFRLAALALAAAFLVAPVKDLYLGAARSDWRTTCGDLVDVRPVYKTVKIHGTRGAHPAARVQVRWTATVAYPVGDAMYYHEVGPLYDAPEPVPECFRVYYDPRDPASSTVDDPGLEGRLVILLVAGITFACAAFVPRRWLRS